MEKVNNYILKNTTWELELTLLRNLLTATELVEEYKWGAPIYTLNGKNVIGIAAFKSYVGLWFHQGVFLKDQYGLLINAQKEKTRGLRQIRFNGIAEIKEQVLKEYIEEAISNQKMGKEIKIKQVKAKDIQIPMELMAQFNQVATLEKAFYALSLSKQKEFTDYISTAKQEKTRLSRLEKITPLVLKGNGLNDQYKKTK